MSSLMDTLRTSNTGDKGWQSSSSFPIHIKIKKPLPINLSRPPLYIVQFQLWKFNVNSPHNGPHNYSAVHFPVAEIPGWLIFDLCTYLVFTHAYTGKFSIAFVSTYYSFANGFKCKYNVAPRSREFRFIIMILYCIWILCDLKNFLVTSSSVSRS